MIPGIILLIFTRSQPHKVDRSLDKPTKGEDGPMRFNPTCPKCGSFLVYDQVNNIVECKNCYWRKNLSQKNQNENTE